MKNNNAVAFVMNEPSVEKPPREDDIDTHPVQILSTKERSAVERFKVCAESPGSRGTRLSFSLLKPSHLGEAMRKAVAAANATLGRRASSSGYPHFDQRSLDALSELAEQIRRANVKMPPKRF